MRRVVLHQRLQQINHTLGLCDRFVTKVNVLVVELAERGQRFRFRIRHSDATGCARGINH